MGDVRVRITFRNDMLQTMIDESGKTMNALSKAIGIAVTTLYSLKAMKLSPYTKGREGYNTTALRVCKYFHVIPEVLFPDDLYRIKWPSKLEKSMPVERVALMLESDNQRMRSLPPHELMEDFERRRVIIELIDTLDSKEQQVIKARFGIVDGPEQTLEEIGETMDLTRERVRQIEIKALHKLRRPSNRNRISDTKPYQDIVTRSSTRKMHKTCANCGKSFFSYRKVAKYCSRKCWVTRGK